MDRQAAIQWIVTVCASLRLSQAKTLAALAVAALDVSRMSLAEIGRHLPDITAKHGIKRAWRFTSNRRIEVSEAMQGLVQRIARRRRQTALVIALDWVEVRNLHTLAAVAVAPGRGLPLLWASYREWEFHTSQNSLEEGLLRLLRSMLPPEVPVILLADRGFGRTELARLCQHLGLHYLVRIRPEVWIDCPRHRGNLKDYPVKKGICHRLRNVQYRQAQPVQQHVVVHWRRGLPTQRDACWFLMTDLDWSGQALVELYGQRMTIEELFRDQKNRRNGWALRHTQVTTPERFDRLLLILAFAYVLLVGLGHYGKRYLCPSTWSSNTRLGDSSSFTTGRCLLDRLQLSPKYAFTCLLAALRSAAPNWG